MLLRINLLMFVYIEASDNEIKFFYIAPLHSLYFLMVYVVLRCGPNDRPLYVLIKLALTFVILTLVHVTSPRAFEATFYQALGLDEYLEVSRFHLDGYATWFGMCCASIFLHVKKLQIEHPESNILTTLSRTTNRRVVALVCLLSFGAWAAFKIERQDRPTFLYFHKWTSLGPIVTYVVLRNVSSNLRRSYIPPMAWFGRHSLEINLLQAGYFFDKSTNHHHVWNAGYPLFTLLLNLCVTMYFAQLAHDGTVGVTNFLMPSKTDWHVIVRTRWLGCLGLAALTHFLANSDFKWSY